MEGATPVFKCAFAMGSTCCTICGQWISQDSKSSGKGGYDPYCPRCLAFVPAPVDRVDQRNHATNNTAAAVLFTPAEIQAAMVEVEARVIAARGMASGDVRAGTTEVDNRVLEDAFCETCDKHRPCKVFSRQTRNADEGQTIFYQCTKCHAEWQLNS